jgi:S1/P1 Nuclease
VREPLRPRASEALARSAWSWRRLGTPRRLGEGSMPMHETDRGGEAETMPERLPSLAEVATAVAQAAAAAAAAAQQLGRLLGGEPPAEGPASGSEGADLHAGSGPFVGFWGEKGHETTNRLAVGAVPSPLQAFYEAHADAIEQHAMDPDHAKEVDPAERPRHVIDLDRYGPYPFTVLPEEYDAAVQKFGEQTVVRRGIVPWQIERTYDLLVGAFRQGSPPEIVKHSAWLGHYVGDAHVPFHTTANYDGQLTGQKGLHSYFESKMVNAYVSPGEVRPPPGTPITARPHLLAFRWVRESYTYVRPLLDADAANGGQTGHRNLAGFAQTAKPIAIDRLTKGASRTASLWYSAWREAGLPALDAGNSPLLAGVPLASWERSLPARGE